jgi:hypothetical protein
MKWLFVVLSIVSSQIVFSQGLKDIFLSLPENHIGLSKFERDTLVKNFIEGQISSKTVGLQKHYLVSYEPQNGYLVFTGAYEGSTKMTFWNLSTGDKLVAIVSGSCGPACTNHISFLLLSKGKYKELQQDEILPKLSFSDFMDVTKMKEDNVDIEKETVTFNEYPLLYGLPSKGKNMRVQSQYQELAMQDNLKKYSLGSRMELLWQDGKFAKGRHME